ncbi:hypothetical protein X474_18700 [Dethiosulfatarculus sandiegensis]|uniref:Uncharacterized protein n=1 Tax=Dethiosulfatarculus sandiegensis TaxID=1429043 RepID=A0A0D2JA79_9BACT|nr:hypothetical protein X474_18700 [Dethiosulfatarculus sandiegensis]
MGRPVSCLQAAWGGFDLISFTSLNKFFRFSSRKPVCEN